MHQARRPWRHWQRVWYCSSQWFSCLYPWATFLAGVSDQTGTIYGKDGEDILMGYDSSEEQREEILLACRVLTHFRIVEGFGHVSTRVEKSTRILITPRTALGLVTGKRLVELNPDGKEIAGQGRPPLEAAMHLAIYRRRPDVNAIVRGHPRHVAAYACAAEPLKIAHGFGANLGAVVPVFAQPFLAANPEMGEAVAEALGNAQGIILQSNGMLAVGESVPHACVQAL